MTNVRAVGDEALEIGRGEATAPAAALVALLRADPSIRDVIVSSRHVLVVPRDVEAAARALETCEARAATRDAPAPRDTRIAVIYDGEDLREVAHLTDLSVDRVVELHASGTYHVAMLGFLPGFAYLEGLDPRLVLPRRDTPRPRVPPGSVAIGAGYTGIYPHPSPGGWWLLGRAPEFRALDDDGATLAVGDRVTFVPVDGASYMPPTTRSATSTDTPHTTALVVSKVAGPALVVDGGRHGHLHEGIPESGPLVVSALARANAAVGNPPATAGLEVYGTLVLAARGGRVRVADDAGSVTTLDDGDTFTVTPSLDQRARHVAVAGGLDVAPFLGSRTTLLVAGVGGHEGRTLRRGDALRVFAAADDAAAAADIGGEVGEGAIRLRPGPDADDATLALLARTSFRISPRSDRTGTRLECEDGSVLRGPAAAGTSRPMVLGAIERTPTGLVVLGPDHPTTGGYPLVAVLAAASRDAFFGTPLGRTVRFSF